MTAGEVYLTNKEILKFATTVKTTVLNIIPPFNQLKLYFDEMLNIFKKLEIPVFWETPAGMKVSSNTRIMKSKKIKTSLLKKAKPPAGQYFNSYRSNRL